MPSDWIKKLADDERKRDGVRSREVEIATRKADLVRAHGQRLLDELRETVARDVEEFQHEFPGDQTRQIVFEGSQPEGGFVVHKPQYPTVSLNVAPRLAAAAVGCQYRFTPTSGLPPREDRFELVFVRDGKDGEEALHFKHHGAGQLFSTAAALSEYLLAPVFTGRPR